MFTEIINIRKPSSLFADSLIYPLIVGVTLIGFYTIKHNIMAFTIKFFCSILKGIEYTVGEKNMQHSIVHIRAARQNFFSDGSYWLAQNKFLWPIQTTFFSKIFFAMLWKFFAHERSESGYPLKKAEKLKSPKWNFSLE